MPASSPVARFWAQLRPELQKTVATPAYRILALLFALYAIVAFAMLNAREVHFTLFAYISILFQPVAVVVFAALYLGWPRTVKDKLERFYKRDFLVSGVLLVVMTLLFQSVYLSLKTSFTDFVPFHADEWLMHADRALHFGNIPWKLIAPVFSNAAAVHATDLLYTFWLLLNLFIVLQQAFAAKTPELRATFFLSYYIVWILLGTVIALAASSAGPCYFQHVSSQPNPYDGQMTFLNSLHQENELYALSFQSTLWENHAKNLGGIVNGISAFPSVHVAMAVIFALVGRHYGRAVRWSSYAYVVIIMIGSIVLNWHYAVDGYASIMLTPVIWMLCRYAVARYKLAVPSI